MKTQKERAEERRRQKLALMQEQVESGQLTVRKMTAKERKENPPRPPGEGRRRK
jgi:hypothetical protein